MGFYPPQPPEPRTAAPCQPPCPERLLAVIEERLVPSKTAGGWIVKDVPVRVGTWRAKYYGQDHTGEYFVVDTCPYCGGILPEPKDDPDPDDGN